MSEQDEKYRPATLASAGRVDMNALAEALVALAAERGVELTGQALAVACSQRS